MRKSKLTEEQRRIICSDISRIQVLSCPGSGKTTTAIGRVKHLVRRRGASPQRILVLAFGRRDVEALSSTLSSHGLTEVRVQTIDAFGLALLKQVAPESLTVATKAQRDHAVACAVRSIRAHLAPELTNDDSAATALSRRVGRLLTQLPSKMLLRRLRHVERVVKRGRRTARARNSVIEAIGAASSHLQARCDAALHAVVVREARRILWLQGLVTYPEMTRRSCLLVKNGAVIPPAFDHVIVDEWQDTSPRQRRLIEAVLGTQPDANVLVLGDADQSVYGFRGAVFTPLADAQSLVLSRTHRLTAKVAELAEYVIGRRPAKDEENVLFMRTRKVGQVPVLRSFKDEESQHQAVASRIAQRIAEGEPLNNMCVIARTRGELRHLERLLRHADIPTRWLAGDADSADSLNIVISLAELVHAAQASQVSRQTRQKVQTWQKRDRKLQISEDSVTAALRADPEAGSAPRESLKRLVLSLSQIRAQTHESVFTLCAKAYLSYLGGVRTQTTLLHLLNTMAPLLRSWSLDWDAARAKLTRLLDSQEQAVTLTTAHGSKGGEWATVFVIGLVEGGWPSQRAVTAVQQAEERRVLYVALTRSRGDLELFAGKRNAGRAGSLAKVSVPLRSAIRAGALRWISSRGLLPVR